MTVELRWNAHHPVMGSCCLLRTGPKDSPDVGDIAPVPSVDREAANGRLPDRLPFHRP